MENTRLVNCLESGIEAKRLGKYDSALEFYAQAQKIDPLDSRSYINSMKVLIGTNQYQQGFRHLLIVAHFNIIDNISKMQLSEPGYETFLPRFKWESNVLTATQLFEPSLVYEGVKLEMALSDLIFRASNLTFYIGHCWVGDFLRKDKKIPFFGENDKLFFNLNEGFLGKLSGQTFRETNVEGYFLSIGFIYAHLNLNFSLGTKDEVVNYYLDKNLELRNDIWNYRQFLIEKYKTNNVYPGPNILEQKDFDIDLIARNAISKYNPESNDYIHDLQAIAYLIKINPKSLQSVSDDASVGKVFLMMLSTPLSTDLDSQQLFSSLGYLFISRALRKNPTDFNLVKDRLLILHSGHESLRFTISPLVRSKLSLVMDVATGATLFEARDALYKMEIADLEMNPIIPQKITFFREKKESFNAMMTDGFFRPQLTLNKLFSMPEITNDIIQSGVDFHTKLLSYLEEKVIGKADIDF